MLAKHAIHILAMTIVAASAARAQSSGVSATPVGVDNFVRAETDLYMSNMARDGSFGKFLHRREPASIDNQTVIRLNRDTLYSAAVFDLDAGPVTITLPDAGKRFMSLQVISEDHYVPMVAYGAGSYTIDRKKVGTRYVATAVRTLVDPSDPKDIQQVHALQDAIKVSQKSPGKFEVANWDQASQKKVRDALIVLGSTIPDFKKAFGTRQQVDPVRHLIGSASAWGGNPDKDATYLNITPSGNDGKTVYKLAVKDVPVNGFWSVSLYNAEGYYQKNPYDAYSLNNLTAKKSPDGSIAIQFGGCDGKIPNCLPTMPGWNYTVRLYRPRAEILNGKWKFPQPQPVS
ncbi:carboxylesterase [Bosea sp. Tri-44]|nr:carboxylesterase [Bosea sp. Tri-44]